MLFNTQEWQPHRKLNAGNLESAHYWLPHQFPNKDYEIMSGKIDSGVRLVFDVGFTFSLNHYPNREEKYTFDGFNAPSKTADMINKHIPNAWMPDLDKLSKVRSELALA